MSKLNDKLKKLQSLNILQGLKKCQRLKALQDMKMLQSFKMPQVYNVCNYQKGPIMLQSINSLQGPKRKVKKV